jgi:hypothetical protein
MLVCDGTAAVNFMLNFTLCCCCTQCGQLTPIDLIVEEHFHRAAPGGMGGTKAAGNYSPVLVTQLAAKKNNYAGQLLMLLRVGELLFFFRCLLLWVLFLPSLGCPLAALSSCQA